ncbi:MAG: 2-amino-4-hydroxy-6-hydroxymethyldihydropteridine diphosphokinase [Pirellulaceae bacterium]
MATALVGLGSNLGDRNAALKRAIELLSKEPRIRVEAVSSFRQSKPAGGPEGQGAFLNAAARLDTSLSPEELLAKLLAMEDQIGRVREERWGPRVIDLDLLLYGRVECKTPTLELPHPRMCYRRFVLEPAAEIAGEMVWPVNGWTVERLRHNLDSTPRYVAFSCVKEDFEKVVDSLIQITTCSVIHGWSHSDTLIETFGTRQWMEKAVSLQRQRNAEALASSARLSEKPWIVSDFWADFEFDEAECLLHANETCRDSETLGRLKEYRSLVQQPRLVVVLDNRDPTLEIVRKRLDVLRRQPDSPPSLQLCMDDPRIARREVLAAMQAME